MTLDKAYKVIIDEQSHIYGRDARATPVTNIHQAVEIAQKTDVTATRMEHYPLQKRYRAVTFW